MQTLALVHKRFGVSWLMLFLAGVAAAWFSSVAFGATALDFDAAVGQPITDTGCSVGKIVRRVVLLLVLIGCLRGLLLAANQNERGWTWIGVSVLVGFLVLTMPTWGTAFLNGCSLV